jgi:ATP-dependent DNA ligase
VRLDSRVAPIAPVARLAPFNHPDWLFEPKYDGFRGVFYLTRRGCAMYSKRGNRFSRFPELCERIRAELPRPEVILDGEVVAIDEGGAGGLLEPDERSGALGRFRREMRTSRTIEFEADHHLFNSHADRTSRELRAFLLAS